MNITFCLLGFTCILEGLIYLKKYWIHKMLLIIFGVGLIFTAIFQHAPINEGISYNVLEDKIHSIFASIVGFSFTLFSFSTAFIEKTNKRKVLALLMGFISIGLSIFMFSVVAYTGIWQRLMFIISFAWVMFFLRGEKVKI